MIRRIFTPPPPPPPPLSPLHTPAGDERPGILVGNKSDLSSRRVVSSVEGARIAHGLGLAYVETSAKDNQGVFWPFGGNQEDDDLLGDDSANSITYAGDVITKGDDAITKEGDTIIKSDDAINKGHPSQIKSGTIADVILHFLGLLMARNLSQSQTSMIGQSGSSIIMSKESDRHLDRLQSVLRIPQL